MTVMAMMTTVVATVMMEVSPAVVRWLPAWPVRSRARPSRLVRLRSVRRRSHLLMGTTAAVAVAEGSLGVVVARLVAAGSTPLTLA